jgi:hypothetical protein
MKKHMEAFPIWRDGMKALNEPGIITRFGG